MRLVSISAAVAGLALISVLVLHFGVSAVTRSLLAVGWAGFAAICLIHLVLIAVLGLAWWALLPGTSPWASIWGRLVRDAGCEVLPLSQVGGFVLGARAMTFAAVSGTAATASTIVDVSLEFIAQLAYAAIGLAALLYLRPDTPAGIPVALGLVVAGLLAAGLVAAQRRGFDLFNRFAGALGRGWAESSAAGAAALHAAVSGIYRRHRRLWANFAAHLACWLISPIEAWLALRLAGAPLSLGAVLVIESLLAAARSAAFAVPNAVGVQEGAYLILGTSFGLTPEMALALSLLKRARDLATGLPALGAWQLLEGGRLWRRVAAPAPVRSPQYETPAMTTGVSALPAGSDEQG